MKKIILAFLITSVVGHAQAQSIPDAPQTELAQRAHWMKICTAMIRWNQYVKPENRTTYKSCADEWPQMVARNKQLIGKSAD